jgi:proprotein convertase subtilisin/kexin type 5
LIELPFDLDGNPLENSMTVNHCVCGRNQVRATGEDGEKCATPTTPVHNSNCDIIITNQCISCNNAAVAQGSTPDQLSCASSTISSVACAMGEWLDTSGTTPECKKCHADCASCLDGTTTKCTRCTHPNAILKGAAFGALYGECKFEAGFYVDPSDTTSVTSCNANCVKCLATGVCEPTGCAPGYKFDTDVCVEDRIPRAMPRDYGTAAAQAGKYWDEDKVLQTCDANCVDCEGTATNCIMCDAAANKQLVFDHTKNEYYCGCKSGFYEDVSTGSIVCTACSTANCAQCDNEDVCQLCVSGRKALSNTCDSTQTTPICPMGTWYDITALACKDCDRHCSTCIGSAHNCIEYTGFAVKKINDTSTPSGGDNYKTKFECAPGSGRIGDGTDQHDFGNGKFGYFSEEANDQCATCAENVKNCHYNPQGGVKKNLWQQESAYIDDSLCYTGYMAIRDYSVARNAPNLKCIPSNANQQCPRTDPKVGSFVNLLSGKCEQCHDSCLTCERYAENCKTCVAGMHLEMPNDPAHPFMRCVPDINTYTRTSVVKPVITFAEPCPLGCTSCEAPANKFDDPTCLTCINGSDAVDGKCGVDATCLNKSVFWNGSTACEDCHASCATCTGNADTDCLSCYPGHVFDPAAGKCVSWTLNGESINVMASATANDVRLNIGVDLTTALNANSITLYCLEGCVSCDDEKTCRSGTQGACDDGEYQRASDNACTPICKSGFMWNATTMVCDAITTVPFTSVSASYGKFWNWDTLAVEDCHESCNSCSGKAHWCVECASGFFKTHFDFYGAGDDNFGNFKPSTCRKCPLSQFQNAQGNCVNTSEPNCLVAGQDNNCRICSDGTPKVLGTPCTTPPAGFPISVKGFIRN